MGQKHSNIVVVRLITKQTIENDILALQEKKKQQVALVMNNSGGAGSGSGEDVEIVIDDNLLMKEWMKRIKIF